MAPYNVAVVGTGPDPKTDDSGQSAAMGYRHARGYKQLDRCEIVACADIVRENAEAFATEFDIEPDYVYEDHRDMLANADPDIVSVAVPPAYHAPIVIDCARQNSVRAIHCEKPMADSWGDSRLMAQECHRWNVQLTFNHQLRFHGAVRKAKELLDGGEIGDLQRLEMSRKNFFDAGTHQVDLCNYFNDDRRPKWVIGQIDYREENVLFGAHNANQVISMWEYENGVHAFAATGDGAEVVDRAIRLLGDGGTIELGGDPYLRIRRTEEADWTAPEWGDREMIPSAIRHLIDCLESGDEPTLRARNALAATEIIFATYESSRRRARIDLPLTIDGNPLAEMVESGDINPEPPTE